MPADADPQSIGLLGDCIVSRALEAFREPDFLKVRDILAATDAVFANLEGAVHPYLDDPFAQRDGGGTYVTIEPKFLDSLKWLGVNMVASGSSHADEFGAKGILDALRYLDAAGIAHAGSGRHLAEARSPAYIDTPTGRIGLVAATAHFLAGRRAGDQRSDTLGWPGVNGVRHRDIYTVDEETLAQLRAIGKKVGWDAEQARRLYMGYPDPGNSPTAYAFMGHKFEVGTEFGIRSVCNKRDLDENMRMVRAARYFSDRVIVSFHVHDQGGPTAMTAERRTDIDDLADFAIDFARQSVDNGADIVVMHGTLVPGAVEIYKGKPIFHSMGASIFQVETMRYLPAEAYERYGLDGSATPAEFLDARYDGGKRGHTGNAAQWEQMFAVCDFDGDTFREARLYPLDLGQDAPITRRGRPFLAGGEIGKRVLDRVARLSAKYDTEVTIRDVVGVVAP